MFVSEKKKTLNLYTEYSNPQKKLYFKEAWESKLTGWLGLGCIQYIKIYIYILTLYMCIIYIIYYLGILYMYIYIYIYKQQRRSVTLYGVLMVTFYKMSLIIKVSPKRLLLRNLHILVNILAAHVFC